MIQPRALSTLPDHCCLPSPHRVLQGVAGMAFNFSKIELSYRSVPRRVATQQEKSQPQKALLTALRG